jgi:hypothetical protein
MVRTESYLCGSALVQKSVTRTTSEQLRADEGKQPGLSSNGLTTKRPGNDALGGHTAGLTAVPATVHTVKHGSFLKDSPEWIGGYHSGTARVRGCDRLEKTACQPYRRSPTPSLRKQAEKRRPISLGRKGRRAAERIRLPWSRPP